MSEGVGSSVGSDPKRAGAVAILGWGAYLACSWTWCIGMFLPVLLVRDYGVWGFIVFAVPNVIGAAAMGWVLRRPGHSEALTAAHESLVRWFSFVTVFFQLFFFSWIVRSISGPALYALIPSVLLLIPSVVTGRGGAARWRLWRSAAVWAASAGGMLVLIARGEIGPPAFSGPGAGLGWLAPVCVLGFGLCPYLDATFHLARQRQTAGPATASFVLGFGVLFFIMILFTLLYAGLFDLSRPMIAWGPAGGLAVGVVFGHVCLQIAFTCLAHGDAKDRVTAPRTESLPASGVQQGLGLGVVVAAITIALSSYGQRMHAGLSGGEIIYRLFMSFYGLLFPAYVWLCMMPTWRRPAPPTARQIAVWLGACAVAAPMYWMGFIEREEWWLGPGLAVVLLARLLIPRAGRGPDGLSGAPVRAPRHPPTLAAAASAGPDHPGG